VTPAARKRLREVWRSAGWPWQDTLELELIATGLLEQRRDRDGRTTVHLSTAGIAALAGATERHRAALAPHEALARRVAAQLATLEGRLVWCGLALRAPLPQPMDTPATTANAARSPDPAQLWSEGEPGQGDGRPAVRWVNAVPDVFSIRRSSLARALDPLIHEIKVRRADLLSDLRVPDKGAAYRAIAGRCIYVLAEGIAEPDEVPAEYGVMLAREAGLELVRAAPRHPLPEWPSGLPLPVWLALAAARPESVEPEPAQALLRDPADDRT
jgi:hypothetical protein